MGGITDALRLSAACSFGMQPVNLLLSLHGIDNFTGLVEFLPAALVNLWRLPDHGDARQRLVTAALALWSVRLGAFLLRRMVARSASDARLDELRRRGPLALAGFWLVHGTWGLVVSLPCTLGCASAPGPARARDVAGFGLWLAGFALESVGDARKARYRERRGADRYFDVGGDPLWTWSRYPHLAGETFCWLGLAVVAAGPPPSGWAFLSPAMTLLLMVGEAAHLAEVKNDARYADSAEFKRYRATTSLLWPVPRGVYASIPAPLRRVLFFDYY